MAVEGGGFLILRVSQCGNNLWAETIFIVVGGALINMKMLLNILQTIVAQ